ncbi:MULTISPECIES: nucleoside 2-deoxyribosyltransferase [unclassified Rhizobium]|uniref:nucleoside 2-deoxyribosyltransferase n=1 Tax=unclassified Rhizobium TaxID=2613769 RepID=UPI0007EBE797|nr:MULTISPECIES: nucleoside 2-deoxyribosyltransferase [unclassified Rhizobium]ANM11366.1 nucleoside 2-deoxyribosyltransferase protein [Rhizobium sp. N324]OYD04970.1 nucleoside 2-deoxyribosyltransferase protein [Rhizobium sp. N4311]
MTRPLVYVAAPLFNSGERQLNLAIRDRLQPHADVYLPQLDGALLEDKVRAGLAPQEAAEAIFEDDCDAVRRSDALLIVLNGRAIDEGAAFELGMAWALGKHCVGFKDDPRQLLATGENPMISQSLRTIFKDLGQVENWAQTLLKGTGLRDPM